METVAIRNQLQAFVQFASRRLETGGGVCSLEDLFQQWQNEAEYNATVTDVREGVADFEGGWAEAAASVFSDIRRQLGIGD